jgi:hypothetical protein
MVSTVRCFLALVCLLVAACCDDPESSGAKSENSVIQAMEARHKSDSVQQLTFKNEMDHHFVFIPWRSGHICVMLDPKYTPHYKQYPWTQNFCITEADYDTIEHSGPITDTVRAALASHVCTGADHLTNR